MTPCLISKCGGASDSRPCHHDRAYERAVFRRPSILGPREAYYKQAAQLTWIGFLWSQARHGQARGAELAGLIKTAARTPREGFVRIKHRRGERRSKREVIEGGLHPPESDNSAKPGQGEGVVRMRRVW